MIEEIYKKPARDLDYWFNHAISIMEYIPVAIVNYDTGEVQYTKKKFLSLKAFNIFFDILKKGIVYQVHLKSYGFSLDEPKIIDRAELYNSFKEYVEQHEKRLGKPHKDWEISYWAIPYKIMHKQINLNFCKIEE